MFLKPSSYYKYRGGFNIRLSVITKLNHEIQEQWHLAPMLVYDSIEPWLSLLPEYRSLSSSLVAMNVFILPFLFWMVVRGHEHINFTFFLFWMAVPGREHINFTSAFISLLFLFSFHNKNVLFCFENKKIQFNEKENNFAFYFHFIFNSK